MTLNDLYFVLATDFVRKMVSFVYVFVVCRRIISSIMNRLIVKISYKQLVAL